MNTSITTSETRNNATTNNGASRKVSVAKAAIKSLKVEANTLSQLLKVMYDLRHRTEIAPLATYLRLTDETAKRVAVAAALRLVAKMHPYVSTDEAGKTTYYKRVKVDGKICKLTATDNAWNILEGVFEAIEQGMPQRIVSEGEYITVTGAAVSEAAAKTAETAKETKRVAREAKRNNAKIAEDLLAALTAVYTAAKNTPAEIHIMRAIAAISAD